MKTILGDFSSELPHNKEKELEELKTLSMDLNFNNDFLREVLQVLNENMTSLNLGCMMDLLNFLCLFSARIKVQIIKSGILDRIFQNLKTDNCFAEEKVDSDLQELSFLFYSLVDLDFESKEITVITQVFESLERFIRVLEFYLSKVVLSIKRTNLYLGGYIR